MMYPVKQREVYPCNGCPRRTITCHSHCPDWDKAVAKEKQVQAKRREALRIYKGIGPHSRSPMYD